MSNSYEASFDGDDTPIRQKYKQGTEHEEQTAQFHNSVMEALIERQKEVFNELGVTEDVLDRLKNLWRKNLQEEQRMQIQKALDLQQQQATDQIHATGA